MSQYKHGVYTRELPTSIVPPRIVDTNTVFAVGTAPVHELDEDKKRYVNIPRRYNSYAEFVEEMGYSDDWNSYTLCEIAESHFAKFGVAPLVVVNVFDPEKHKGEDNTPDVSKVTSADIIGGIDENTLEPKGLECISLVFPKFGLVPFAIVAPKFSMDAAVAQAMAAKSQSINGLFFGMAYADIPHKECPKYADISEYKQKKGLNLAGLTLCWPKVALGDKVYHLSTQLVGRISAEDNAAGGTPQVSPSNKTGYFDRSVTIIDGVEKEVWLTLENANVLNSQGVVTTLNFDGGWRIWGNRTAVYPSNTDPKDSYLCCRRFFNWYMARFILTYFQKVDAPMTKRLIKTITQSAQLDLDGLTAREVILGGKITFLESENPVTDLLNGLLRFHFYIMPPIPAEAIEGVFELDPSYLEELFAAAA